MEEKELKLFLENFANRIVAMKFNGMVYNIHIRNNDTVHGYIDGEDGLYEFTLEELSEDKNLEFYELTKISWD